MIRLIPSKIHGVLDYLSAALFIALPPILGWADPERALLMIVGFAILIYSLATKYELGIFRAISMPMHLALDALGGIVLILSPLIFNLSGGNQVTTLLVIFGALELAAAALTTPRPDAEPISGEIM